MLEYGQPMHAFDLKYVKDGQIVVRNAAAGETITTLDGTVRELSPEMLVIADAEKPSAVAGVMGGEYSGIHNDTNTIVFESACFKGSSVRLTAKKLGMRTESSGRFEKGLDPMNCEGALLRALELVEQLGAGEVVSGVIDIDHADHALRRVPFDADWMNRFLGISLTREEMVESLRPLEIAVVGNECIVPSYRADLEQKADIAEEVARMYGYNKIPTTALRGSAEAIVTPEQDFERRINNAMIAMGYDEIVTYSFMSPKMYDKICLPADHPMRKSVVITNPLGEDTSIMRTTGLPSMLDTLARNYNNRNPEAWLYEISSEYLPREGEDAAGGKGCPYGRLLRRRSRFLHPQGRRGKPAFPPEPAPCRLYRRFHPSQLSSRPLRRPHHRGGRDRLGGRGAPRRAGELRHRLPRLGRPAGYRPALYCPPAGGHLPRPAPFPRLHPRSGRHLR